MGDENPIRALGDYSKPSHKGHRNTIELPVGDNVVPLLSDTIRLVQNGCSFHGLRSEDPNQHLNSWTHLTLTVKTVGSITTWEDLTTHFLSQFFPPGRTAKLRNDILMFQQHHGESLSEAWTLHRRPDSPCMTEKGVKNDIDPRAPTMTVSRLVLDWEEKIKLHFKREIEFNQWRRKSFKGKHPTLITTKGGMDDEGEVT
ncbi:zinc finger, CCHC-type containing protein [Tanacetum coccineum]